MTVTLNETFVEVIQAALKARFGRIPSASFIALQVNRRLGERQGVSGESARRWLRGLAMPKYVHLGALTAWLEIDLGEVLRVAAYPNASSPPI